jgi:hypothetical protein
MTMITVYKLTDSDGYTRRGQDGETHWRIGETVTVAGDGTALCTSEIIHAYLSPEITAFMNPIHAAFDHPHLYAAETPEVVANSGTKIGVKTLTLRERFALPQFTKHQRILAALRIALELTGDWPGKEVFTKWAEDWKSGKDRTYDAAYAANANAANANAAAYTAAYTAAANAANANAANAAYAAAAAKADAAYAAAYAAAAAAAKADAAYTAAYAAAAAANVLEKFSYDLTHLLQEVLATEV